MKRNLSCHSSFEHDITFCKAGLCPKSSKCFRFIDNHKFDGEYISVSDFYNEKDKKCKDFMLMNVFEFDQKGDK